MQASYVCKKFGDVLLSACVRVQYKAVVICLSSRVNLSVFHQCFQKHFSASQCKFSHLKSQFMHWTKGWVRLKIRDAGRAGKGERWYSLRSRKFLWIVLQLHYKSVRFFENSLSDFKGRLEWRKSTKRVLAPAAPLLTIVTLGKQKWWIIYQPRLVIHVESSIYPFYPQISPHPISF